MSSTKKSMKSDSNSSSVDKSPPTKTTVQLHRKPAADRWGMVPECVYCAWNICFGVFLLFTTAWLSPGDLAAVVTQCFAVVYIFAGMLSFVIIFKSARSIFVVLTVFAGMTTVLTSLTILGFVYAIEGSMPLPELMMKSQYLEYILGGLLVIHLILNFVSFFVFLTRSCKSSADLDSEYSQRVVRPACEKKEKSSAEIIVMDY